MTPNIPQFLSDNVRNTAEYNTVDQHKVKANQGQKDMAASSSSVQTSDSALNGGFGVFMWNLEEK